MTRGLQVCLSRTRLVSTWRNSFRDVDLVPIMPEGQTHAAGSHESPAPDHPPPAAPVSSPASPLQATPPRADTLAGGVFAVDHFTRRPPLLALSIMPQLGRRILA